MFTTCRIDCAACRMDDETLALMSKAGFKKISFGVESGSERIQKFIQKDINNQQVFETINKTMRHGITPKFHFMAGFPKESISDFL